MLDGCSTFVTGFTIGTGLGLGGGGGTNQNGSPEITRESQPEVLKPELR